MTKNHFDTLGLKPGATEDDIKKAYRNLAKKWHPDKNDDSGAEEKFKEISAAYEFLKNDDRREILERDLSRPAKQTESSYSFKSEFKTSQNGDSDSYWSKKFGQKSETRYKDSTFGSFADEGREPSFSKKEPPFSKKKETPKTNQKKKKPSRPNQKKSTNGWSSMDDQDEYFDIPTSARSNRSQPNFSFAFKSFVDDLGMSFDAFFMGPSMNEPFQFSSFFNGSDPFTEFFANGKPGSLFPPRKDAAPPRRPRKHEVAPEDGASGLNPEYMFSSPTSQRPDSAASFSNKENTMYADTDRSPGRDESDDDDMDSRLYKCSYCERRMPFSQLSTHEPGCALRRGGKFDNTSEDGYDNYAGDESPDEDQYPQRAKMGDWRQTHEELLENIRRAKAKAKARHSAGSRMTSDSNKTATGTEDHLSQTRCKWCGRYFSHVAARQHVPFCEKWTKEHGKPLNPAGKATSRDQGSKNQKARQYAKHIPKPRGHSQEKMYEPSPPPSPRTSFDEYPEFPGSKRETMNKPAAHSGTGLHASTGYSSRGAAETKPSSQRTMGGTPPFPTGPSFTHRASSRPTMPPTGGTSSRTSMPTGGSSSRPSMQHPSSRPTGGSGSRPSMQHPVGSTSSRTTMPPPGGGTGAGRYSAMNGVGSTTFRSSFDDGYGFGVSGSQVKADTRPVPSCDSCPTCSKRYGSYGKIICSCGSRRKTGA